MTLAEINRLRTFSRGDLEQTAAMMGVRVSPLIRERAQLRGLPPFFMWTRDALRLKIIDATIGEELENLVPACNGCNSQRRRPKMEETTILVCPSPSCPDRTVENNGTVTRAEWESAWLGQTETMPGEWKTPECFACGAEGIDPESDQLDSAEEELGVRCSDCGIVSARHETRVDPKKGLCLACPHCGSLTGKESEGMFR